MEEAIQQSQRQVFALLFIIMNFICFAVQISASHTWIYTGLQKVRGFIGFTFKPTICFPTFVIQILSQDQ